MIYPDEVQEYIDILDEYEINDNLKEFDIFHMYPREIAYPEGYYDSRFFDLIGYNTETMQKCSLGKHDSMVFGGNTKIRSVKIFMDGSTMIRMKEICIGLNLQAYNVMSKAEYEEYLR